MLVDDVVVGGECVEVVEVWSYLWTERGESEMKEICL